MSLFDFFRRRRTERDMDAEMRFHVDMEAAELERSGVPRDEARRQALAAFGGVTRFKEEARDNGWTSLENIARDVRYATRSLIHSRGYALVVILTLALGIAANASIFSVANGILFRPLPYREPGKLMVIWDQLDWWGVKEAWVSGPEVVRLRTEATRFEGFAAMRANSVTIAGSTDVEPQQVASSAVSANFFQLLGSGPTVGRGFAPGEDAPGMPRLAVLSHRLWTQRYGSDSSLIGRTITVDGNAAQVVGILPVTFRFSPQQSLASNTGDADIYLTLPDTLSRMAANTHSLAAIGRIRTDANTRDALAELDAISAKLDEELYGKRGFRFNPVMLQERVVRDVRPALLALLGAVGALMLIMCANLAVLALVRAARREREITVRRAIGASAARVTRQILAETVLLSLAGAAVGILLSQWSLRGLLAIAPAGLPRRSEIGIDWVVLVTTLGVAVAIGLAMGFAPVIHSLRSDIASVLREKAPSRSGNRARRMLVVAQVAISMVLLAGTGLLLGSFVRLLRVDGGFNAENVLKVELLASRAKYATGGPVVDAVERFSAALRQLPGVVAVGASMATPLSAGANQSGISFPASPTNTGKMDVDGQLADLSASTPGYFEAMGIKVVEGEDFTARQNADSVASRVAIVDELVAKRYFPEGNVVGQPIIIDGDTLRVSGVARHVRLYGLQEEGRGQVWVPHRYATYRYLAIMVRTSKDPLSIAAAARRAIRGVDPDQAVMRVSAMSETVRESLAERRLVLTLVSAFAAAALVLAALGVYGVTASSVALRTRELGIRMALGASRSSVITAVLGEPAMLVAFGLALGLAGTIAAKRLVEGLLYGVTATDPMTLLAVGVVLLLVGLVAGYLPARRATKVDPAIALRSD